MPKLFDTSPQITVKLYKGISRQTVDGETGVSARYQGKDEYIDLNPYLNIGSHIRTSKSVKEPAGAFYLTFADKPHNQTGSSLESLYGLIEPMDMIEIRMWSGIGDWDVSAEGKPLYPVKMRGFISKISRSMTMSEDGKPQRTVTVVGHDYGKIWQMYQVLHLPAYNENQALLSNYGLWEIFGVEATNVMTAGQFVTTMIDKIINPFLSQFMPANTRMPTSIKTDIRVAHGVINNSYQNQQGSIFEILRFHGDVGIWNELYTEDREDGVYCVYRPVPSVKLQRGADTASGLIQTDATMPDIVIIDDYFIKSISTERGDDNVANFFWVNNARYDMIDDMPRKLAAIAVDDSKVSLTKYPNSAVKYYGLRAMYAETQQSDDGVTNATSGQSQQVQDTRSTQQLSWIDERLRILRETNKDNVVYERGSAMIKGGIQIKAGDYALFKIGTFQFVAYVNQVDEDFSPFQGYTTTLTFERCEGFVERIKMETGTAAPWLSEQASRR